MMGQLTPGGVADDTSRDGAEGVPSRASVESFWSKGRLLPPVLGPRHKGIRTRSYYGGGETVQIQFGEFGHHTEVWTTLEGVEALIGDLQAAVVRARIEQDRFTGEPGTYVPQEIERPAGPFDDLPF